MVSFVLLSLNVNFMVICGNLSRYGHLTRHYANVTRFMANLGHFNLHFNGHYHNKTISQDHFNSNR